MNSIESIKQTLDSFIQQQFGISNCRFSFELNIDIERKFGDISTNVAMLLAKELKKAPRMVAEDIINNFKHEYIQKLEIAGPGFINIWLTPVCIIDLMKAISIDKNKFFTTNNNQKHTYNVEFLSANPTGPIHLGNGRGGIIGDVLGNVLRFVGNHVTKEYYINDAGNQITKLGMSFKIRCQQALGQAVELPEESYHGEYLIEMAQDLVAKQGQALLEKPDSFFADYAKDHILAWLKNTLQKYGIEYDVWFSEKSLHDSGALKKAIDILTQRGYTYTKEDALWFKSTQFGDDKDRVLIRSNGEPTYTAADIAYMQNKIDRGADYMIMTLGHDHHSFAQRLSGLHQALGLEKYPLEVILYQLVKMKLGNEQVRMSKRAGNAITLEDVVDTVGKDVARFFYLHKKADAQLEFDLDLALKQTDENPVFYIQYAYVRALSILKKAQEAGIEYSAGDLPYINESEYSIIKKIVLLQEILSTIETTHQTHLLANYVIELATMFHAYYNQNKILGAENEQIKKARLMVLKEISTTLKTCFDLMGISSPEKM